MNAVLLPVAPPAPDLFGEVPAPAANDASASRLEFTGTLVLAELRSKICDRAGHAVPVLCLHLAEVGPSGQSVYAEHAYTEITRPEAESWAKRLRKGMRITVSTALSDIRLTLPAADFAIDLPTPQEESTP
jgi:hypothetical protein